MVRRIRFVPRQKGVCLPDGARWIGRPTRWANPFKPNKAKGEHYGDMATHRRLVELFAEWLRQPEQAGLVECAKVELRGIDLACSCNLELPCHADVWLAIANGLEVAR